MRTKRLLEKEVKQKSSRKRFVPQAIGISVSDIPIGGSSLDVPEKWYPVKLVHSNFSKEQVEEMMRDAVKLETRRMEEYIIELILEQLASGKA